MFKKLVLMLIATFGAKSFAEMEVYGCRLPKPGADSSVFLFAYDAKPLGLLEGDSGRLAKWPYGDASEAPIKCGVAPVYDLTRENSTRSGEGVKTDALQFTCQLFQASEQGISLTIVSFMFDRKEKKLWNANYSDGHINVQVKDKYITSSSAEPRRFACQKLEMPQDPGDESDGDAN